MSVLCCSTPFLWIHDYSCLFMSNIYFNCWFSHSDMNIQYIPPADWAVNACYHLTQDREQGHSLCDRPPSETKVKGQTVINVALIKVKRVDITASQIHARVYSSLLFQPSAPQSFSLWSTTENTLVTLWWLSGIFICKRTILHKLRLDSNCWHEKHTYMYIYNI